MQRIPTDSKRFRATAFVLLTSAAMALLPTPKGMSFAGDAKAESGDGASGSNTMRFNVLESIDREGTGGEAFRILLPGDWNFDGGVRWRLDNPAMPATIAFVAGSPEGSAALEAFPSEAFFWTNSPEILSQHPRGSRYYGGEVRPPAQPLEALKDIVIPRFRPDVKDLKVIKEQSLPRLAKDVGAGILSQRDVTASALGGRIRIQYTTAGGLRTEEEIYCVVHTILFHFPAPTGTRTNILWTVSHILSFRWPEGAFQEHAQTLETLARSYKISPDWFNKYSQLVATLMQNRTEQIENMRQISDLLARAKKEINPTVSKTFREQQEVTTNIADDFGRTSPDLNTYRDPRSGEDVKLPSGYAGVWTNNRGEYLLSRDGVFPRNQQSGPQEWTPLSPASTSPKHAVP